MFVKLSFVIVCLCVPFSQPNENDTIVGDTRVANGWLAHKGDVPYQAALKAFSDRERRYITYCGAVIIAPSKLLTAAHCLIKNRSAKRDVGLGSAKVPKYMLTHKYAVAGNLNLKDDSFHDDSDEYGQWRSLRSALFPLKYKFPYHDIATVFTYKPFNFNKFIYAIPVASRHAEYYGSCLVTSYGLISDQAWNTSLICTHMNIIPTPLCNRLHRRNMESFICTTTKIIDIARIGDSGGSLVCLNTGDPNEGSGGILVGVISGHRPNAGTFFTRVSTYNRLIERDSAYSIQKCNVKLIFVCLLITSIYGAFCLF